MYYPKKHELCLALAGPATTRGILWRRIPLVRKGMTTGKPTGSQKTTISLGNERVT